MYLIIFLSKMVEDAFQLCSRICHLDDPGKQGELKLNGTHLLA
jgi:hypothetical protein